MKNKITASEVLNNFLNHDENIEIVLDYDDFLVIRFEYQYFLLSIEQCGNKQEYVVSGEVYPVACLQYSINNDVIADGETLSELFDNAVCGEQITDENIYYWWFEEIE